MENQLLLVLAVAAIVFVVMQRKPKEKYCGCGA